MVDSRRSPRWLKAVLWAVGVVVLLLAVSLMLGGGLVTRWTTAPDQVALHYHAGPLSATKFANCIGPSDKHFNYPAGQRTFEFQQGSVTSDSGPMKVLMKDNVEITVSGVARFNLDSGC